MGEHIVLTPPLAYSFHRLHTFVVRLRTSPLLGTWLSEPSRHWRTFFFLKPTTAPTWPLRLRLWSKRSACTRQP